MVEALSLQILFAVLLTHLELSWFFFRVDNFLHEVSWLMINYILLSIISGILNSSINIYSHQKTFLFI